MINLQEVLDAPTNSVLWFAACITDNGWIVAVGSDQNDPDQAARSLLLIPN